MNLNPESSSMESEIGRIVVARYPHERTARSLKSFPQLRDLIQQTDRLRGKLFAFRGCTRPILYDQLAVAEYLFHFFFFRDLKRVPQCQKFAVIICGVIIPNAMFPEKDSILFSGPLYGGGFFRSRRSRLSRRLRRALFRHQNKCRASVFYAL